MAKRSQTLTLPVPPAEALNVCTRSLLALGWEVERSGDRIEAHEEAATLCCHTSPVAVGVEARPAAGERSTVALDFESGGMGPIESRRLSDHMRAVALVIARRV